MAARSKRWLFAFCAPAIAAARAVAQDSIGFSHESYVEDHDRMSVQTESLRIQKTLTPWLDLRVSEVFDAISGATPIGAPAINQLNLHDPRTLDRIPTALITGFTRPLDGVSGASPVTHAIAQNLVSLAQSTDNREGTDVSAGITWGSNHFLPEFSYSNESDYVSYGAAINYSRDFNEKNTTLNVGWSHAYDLVLSNQFTYLTHGAIKNTDDFIVGATQLLGPHTIFGGNITIGHAHGYLDDPYRSVVFDETILDPNARVILSGEKRPSNRDSQMLFLSLTQALPSMDASIEGTYRLYHDSYGILANTVGVAWYQKLGIWLVLSPSVRYYRQDAANFYGIQFPGSPTNDPAHVPQFYSSDYRLSYFETFTIGLEATVTIHDQWDIHLGYQRYWMHGLDHQTMQSTYPNANIFTAGLTYRF
jgi:Protein of unknown function (DUF3570)